MQGSFEITREIDIDASPETVFRFFTLRLWYMRFVVVPLPRPSSSRTTR